MQSASVKVAVRVRPMAAKELLANSSECIEIIPGTQQIVVGGGPACGVGTDSVYTFTQKSFTFDYLFDDNCSQEFLYDQCVSPLVDRFLEGFNATILAYGQTGSGKTYTMGIGLDSINSSVEMTSKGIVPRAISALFTNLAKQRLENPDFDAMVSVSFMELYNEELVDLLNPRPRSASTTNAHGPTIREDGSGKIVWQNLSEEVVTSTAELLNVLQKGSLCRTTGSTDMNASSSRSHAIFTVTLKQSKPVPSDGESKSTLTTTLLSKFHFVDLAGSERLKRTNAEGDRKKEGISINQGLLALGNVISALGDESRKGGHVPYRDSKLTRMLQDSLGGNSQTLMLACISPSDLNYGETVNTLHYANRARNIKNTVEINQDWGGGANADTLREIKTLRSTISQLRTEIAMIRANGVAPLPTTETNTTPAIGASQIQYHQRRERDQLAEIDTLKAKLANQEFLVEQFQFLAMRLRDRAKHLMSENADLATQRDTAIAEKCQFLKEHASCNLFKKEDQEGENVVDMEEDEELPARKKRRSRESSPNAEAVKRSRSPDGLENSSNISGIIKKYVEMIAKLRIQLSESEDRLAWQYEAMAKLGKKGAKSRTAWDEASLMGIDINTSPSNSRIDNLKDSKELPVLSQQRKILEAIRENIEIRNGRDFNTKFKLDMEASISNLHDQIDHLGSSLKFQFNGPVDDNEEDGTNTLSDTNQDSNLFLLINAIQNDISRHESLMERNQKREAEYEKMQKAYESKLSVLQNQMVRIQEERDLALKKLGSGSKQGQHEEAKNRYEEAKRRLDNEISDTRKKMGENFRLRTNNKARTDKLTSELQATIASLKEEKSRMMQQLKAQIQKHNDAATATQREIALLRRKEKNATDVVRKLERSNQLQKLMLKKRGEEVLKSKNQLKQIMHSLKRAATPNKISKSGYTTSSSPIPQKLKGNPRNRGLNEILASVNSPVRVSVSDSLKDMRSEDIDVSAQFKKQMVDKELNSTIQSRKTQRTLEKLQILRNKLIDEQKELLSERKRVVEAHFQATGILDEKAPQYMDDRVQAIDIEIASIDNTMMQLEESIKSSNGIISENQVSTFVDLNWDNALNLCRALDRLELEATVSYFLEDIVSLRISEDEYQQELEQKESAIESLRAKLFEVQETLMKKINAKMAENNNRDNMEVEEKRDVAIETEPFEFPPKRLPGLFTERATSALSFRGRISQGVDVASLPIDVIQDTMYAPVALRNPSPRQLLQPRAMSISPSPSHPETDPTSLRGRLLGKRDSLPSLNRSISPSKDSETGKSSFGPGTFHRRLEAQDESFETMKHEDDSKPKKKFELLSMGGAMDVFKRLANSHTQASQAKVIHRQTVDRDALMQEHHPETKRKSLSELEQAWNFDST